MKVDNDVVIVGAGPAGLSAALLLGRCRRRVTIFDTGQPRNAASHGVHCFLSRENISPKELLRIARDQLQQYESVRFINQQVIDAARFEQGFAVTLQDGSRHTCRKLLIATGVIDDLPEVEGVATFYSRSVHHCPYCDGWEHRDQALAVYGRGEKGYGLALLLKQWSKRLVLCTDGAPELTADQLAKLALHRIAVLEKPLARMEGTMDGQLERIVFSDGSDLRCEALFFNTGQRQHSSLLRKLGVDLTDKGGAKVCETEESTVPGLFVAGDASRDVQLAIVAAAEGVQAAFAINKALLIEAGLCDP